MVMKMMAYLWIVFARGVEGYSGDFIVNGVPVEIWVDRNGDVGWEIEGMEYGWNVVEGPRAEVVAAI